MIGGTEANPRLVLHRYWMGRVSDRRCGRIARVGIGFRSQTTEGGHEGRVFGWVDRAQYDFNVIGEDVSPNRGGVIGEAFGDLGGSDPLLGSYMQDCAGEGDLVPNATSDFAGPRLAIDSDIGVRGLALGSDSFRTVLEIGERVGQNGSDRRRIPSFTAFCISNRIG